MNEVNKRDLIKKSKKKFKNYDTKENPLRKSYTFFREKIKGIRYHSERSSRFIIEKIKYQYFILRHWNWL